MKILMINSFYPPNGSGGAERSVKVLAEGMSSLNHEVVSVSIDDKEHIKYENKVKCYFLKSLSQSKKKYLRMIFFHLSELFNLYKLFQVMRICIKEKPDVIHYNNLYGFSCSILFISKLLRIRSVLTVRDYYLMCYRSSLRHRYCNNKQSLLCKILTYPKKILVNNLLDVVISNSYKTLDVFESHGYFKSKVINKSVIYSGISKKDECPSHYNKSHKKITKGEDIVFGFIGKVCEDKGADVFISISESFNNKFILAGRWALKNKNPLDLGENCNYIGFCNISDFFKNIDVLIVPSVWHDPLPRTVFEAMSYGIPVIGSNMGGIPEAITDECGWIFKLEEEKSLHDCISNIFRDTSVILDKSKASCKKSLYFKEHRVISEYLNLYQED